MLFLKLPAMISDQSPILQPQKTSIVIPNIFASTHQRIDLPA